MVTLRPSKWKRCLIIGCTILAGLFLGQVVAAAVGYYRPTTMSWFSSRLIAEYLQSHPLRKLQIGAGHNDIPGWLNTDIEPGEGEAYLDASRRFPLPDRSFHYVYSEHVLEHLEYEQGMNMLRESYRILAPGGAVRVATPNLLKFIELFQTSKNKQMQAFMNLKMDLFEWPRTPDPECYILNRESHDWGHQFLYTPLMLRVILQSLGFRNIKEFQTGESDDAALRNSEERIHGVMKEANAYETMVFQAIRE